MCMSCMTPPPSVAKAIADPATDFRVAPGTSMFRYTFKNLGCCGKLCVIECMALSCCMPLCLPGGPCFTTMLGVPSDAELLSVEEQRQFLQPWQGDWEISHRSTQGPAGSPVGYTVRYTHVKVEGNKYTLSGGVHDTEDGPYPNEPQDNYFKVFRSADGKTTYLDHMGSRLEKYDASSGELVIVNALNFRITWSRTIGQQPLPKTVGEELRDLKDLHDQGAISNEQYESAKASVLKKHSA